MFNQSEEQTENNKNDKEEMMIKVIRMIDRMILMKIQESMKKKIIRVPQT